MSLIVAMLMAQTSKPVGPQPMNQGLLMGGFLIFMLVFYTMMMRGRSKEKKKFESMLKSLKRNDRIQTIGGIFGTVVNDVKDEDTEITIKVDETNNVKIKINRTAIREVVRESAG